MRSETPEVDGTPRWVKIFVIATLVVAGIVVILWVTGTGDHGPGRHTAGSDSPSGLHRA